MSDDEVTSRDPIVEVVLPAPKGVHLGGCRLGDYIRFAEPDTRGTKPRWDTETVYQLIGHVPKTPYARILPVTGPRILFQAPRTTKVRKVRLVSAKFEDRGA